MVEICEFSPSRCFYNDKDGWYHRFTSEIDTDITIKEGVKTIPIFAFSNNCEKLERVIISDSVVDIGPEAFFNCKSLKYVKLGNGIKKIGNAFQFCRNLEQIEIPDSVKEIQENAFMCCSKLPHETWLKIFKINPNMIIDGMPKEIREDFIVKNKKEIYEIMLKRGDSEENREVVLEIGKILNTKQKYETLVQQTLNPDKHENNK